MGQVLKFPTPRGTGVHRDRWPADAPRAEMYNFTKARVEEYLDTLVEESTHNTWSAFRLALLQVIDEDYDTIMIQMGRLFGDMPADQFHLWLDEAAAEVEQYTNILEEE